MKGYFSQLARHTGLRFTNAARPMSSAIGAQQPSPSPLHVEEVTFVPPPATVNTVSTTEPTSVTPALDKQETARAQTIQTSESTPSIQTGAVASFPKELSTEIHVSSLASDTGRGLASLSQHDDFQPLSTEHPSPFPERNVERDLISTRPADDDLQLERVAAFAAPEQDHQTSAEPPAQAVNDLNPSDPVEREVLVRQYLREVRAWVAAPPTPIADVDANEIVEESPSTPAWEPESIATLTVDREPSVAKQTTQRDHIDVHETSLSIGSISVVIEDPKPNVTTIAPTPIAPGAPKTQPQPEPTSLSRYYLQRW